MKKILSLVLSLTIISAICSAILATVNAVTKDQIEKLHAQATLNAAKLVMPAAATDVVEHKAAKGSWFEGKDATGQVLAYAAIGTDHHGYGGDVSLMVGFEPGFKIVTYKKLAASETPGLGSKLTTPEFMKQFAGMNAAQDIHVKKDGGTVDAITSATVTSRAVCGAINDARKTLAAALAPAK